jgi:hypothetical protein
MTRRLRGALATVLALAPLPRLQAQSPVVTPNGDPSVRSDSIYRLAADSAKYPGQSTRVLLDDGVVRIERDGRETATYRQVIQILRQDAVERFAEQSFSWVPGRQTLRVNWVRVVKPDGTVVSAAPSQVQDSDVPAEMSDPVYTDRRVRRMSLSGVAVGTLVDVSVTTQDTMPFPPNDASGSWSVSMGVPVGRSRLVLDVPADVPMKLVETNLDFRRTEQVAGGRRVYTWARADVPKIEPQLFAADSNTVFMSLGYALPRAWADIGRWYAGLAKDRYALGPATRAKVREVVAGARTRDDSVRAVHRWVAQDVRYVSIALGVGGYRPRSADSVVASGYGDCKDKATLFVAVLRDWGMKVDPVLLRTGEVERRLPSVGQLNHAIAALERPDGGYQFVDLTASLTPWGELPYSIQGEFALVVRADGRVDEATIPRAPVESNRATVRLAAELTPDGMLSGRYEETDTGVLQYALRGAAESPLDSTQRAQAARGLAGRLYAGMTGDSLVIEGGRDLRVTPRVALRVYGARAATKSGASMILTLPLGSMAGVASLADQLEAQGPRRFTIDAQVVSGYSVRETEVRITLPAGWAAQLPAGVHATSRFGEFHSEYAQQGRELVVKRRQVGTRGVQAPETSAELVKWLREMAKEDTQFIVLQPASTAGADSAR